MKAAQWLKRGVNQLKQRVDLTPASRQPPEAAEWLAPELPPAPVPEADSAVLRQWLAQVSSAAAVVLADAHEVAAEHWHRQRLGELNAHLDYLQHSGPEQFEVLQEFVAGVLQAPAGRQALYTLPGVHQRMLLWLTAHNRRSDVLLVLADLQDNGHSYRLSTARHTETINDLTAEPSYLPMLSNPVDPALLRLTMADLPLATRLTGFAWTEDGTLELGGWAYLPGIDPAACALEVRLQQAGSTNSAALAVIRGEDLRIDGVAADRWMSYAGAAFTATVDPRELPDLELQSRGVGEWALEVTMRFGEISVSGLVRIRDADTVPRRLPVGPLVNERTRLIGLMDGTEGLRLKRVRYSCAATLELAGTTVTVSFDPERGITPSALHLEVQGGPSLELQATDTSGTSFEVDMSSVGSAAGGQEKRWTVTAVLPNGRTEPVGWAGSGAELTAASDPAAALRAECTGYGYLQIVLRPVRVTLSSAEVGRDGATLVLEGRLSRTGGIPSPALPGVLLRTARNEVRPLSTAWLDGKGHRFRTEFPLTQDKWGLGDGALESGHYRVLCAVAEDSGRDRHVRVQAMGQLRAELPLGARRELADLELVGEGNDEDLVLRVSAPRDTSERSALGRGRLISDYSGCTDAVDGNAVLFETFDGKSCSDSGRAVSDVLGSRRPDLRRYWTVADFSVPVPENCTPVLRESAEWFRLLATAGYLVNNNNFPHYFRKRPEQFYLQTWHGTPLKRVGFDTPIVGTTASYRALLQREAKVWDMLVAQNEFAADTLAAAFGYRGRTAVLGYPRNDTLADVSAPLRREEARDRLGIAAEQKVLLYMPTWRDSASTTDPYLDFKMAETRLGADYVLLYRGHHKIAGRRKTTGQSLYLDVTTYPQVNDLYLAADLLVTDYSSAMFDFSVTGKPMYFLAPDLERYRDTERGFYFDFEEQLPGPLVGDTNELMDAILSDEARTDHFSLRYQQFADRYAPADDGAAAARIVRSVWGAT